MIFTTLLFHIQIQIIIKKFFYLSLIHFQGDIIMRIAAIFVFLLILIVQQIVIHLHLHVHLHLYLVMVLHHLIILIKLAKREKNYHLMHLKELKKKQLKLLFHFNKYFYTFEHLKRLFQPFKCCSPIRINYFNKN